jgi:uridine phosphorylase
LERCIVLRSKPPNLTFDAIVNPVVTPNTPDAGEVAVLVSSASDLKPLKQGLPAEKVAERKLFMSRYYLAGAGVSRVSLVGPIMGAPYAVALLDTLVAWGARHILFLGWCGALSSRIDIGDIVLPNGAFIDEGTSRHYGGHAEVAACPAGRLAGLVGAACDGAAITCHQGPIWTTDAIYRETEQQVRHFQGKGALAVEMEVSALFSAARFRGVDIGCVLVTSDKLHDMRWQPGFKDSRFLAGRQAARAVILKVLANIQELGDG